MDKNEIKLVKSSFEEMMPISDKAAEVFYNKLFELDPSLKNLFKHDMQKQGKMLMAALRMVFWGLDEFEVAKNTVQSLALRHLDYGVKEEHYPTFGEALLYTVREMLADKWDDELEKAWSNAYTNVQEIMTSKAYK